MKLCLYLLGAGLLVGVVYGLLGVCSPAPPVIALLGLLVILLGEQAVPVAKRMIVGHSLLAAWSSAECDKHIFGSLPGHGTGGTGSSNAALSAPDASA